MSFCEIILFGFLGPIIANHLSLHLFNQLNLCKDEKIAIVCSSLGGALFNEVSAGNPQNIPLQIINGSVAGNQSTKAPLRPLVITQDDYILTFPAQGTDYMLVLRDDKW